MQVLKKNRKYFFTAVNTGYVSNEVPNERCCEFYRKRSGNGLYCAIVGNIVIPNGVGSNDVCAKISQDFMWEKLTDSIKNEGALAGIQLASTWEGYQGIKEFSARVKVSSAREYYKSFAASITDRDVLEAFNGLFRGTDLAIKAGFNHIQIHAGHGYLFNLLIDRRFSLYADLALDLLGQWSEYVLLHNVESSIRFSMWSGDPQIDQDRGDLLIEEISKLPIDFFDASVGFYNIDKRLIYPSTTKILYERIEKTLNLAQKYPHKKFILSGLSSHAWDESLPKNIHIGICRDLIANPNFLQDKSNGCKKSMKCHYFSRGTTNLTCGKWNSF